MSYSEVRIPSPMQDTWQPSSGKLQALGRSPLSGSGVVTGPNSAGSPGSREVEAGAVQGGGGPTGASAPITLSLDPLWPPCINNTMTDFLQ